MSRRCPTTGRRSARSETTRCPTRYGFGLGWLVFEWGDQRLVWHGGNDANEHATGYIDPRTGDGAIVFTNGKLVDLVGDRDLPFLEHGYPSYFTHAVFDAPYLGYRGFLSFVDRVANRLALCEAMGVGARHR